MGRKKRKIEEPKVETQPEESPKQEEVVPGAPVLGEDKPKKSSNYGLTSHAGVVIGADHLYISESEDKDSEDEYEDVDVVLSNSKTGLMRRGGLLQHAFPVQHKQWVRHDAEDAGDTQQHEDEDLSLLDPEERAARLQAAQERAEAQEKQAALLKEAQQNAGRDPTLFSKRTAFDIRFDQMEDKPWTRAADHSDYFNYNLTEEAWLEYAAQQMTIRQELQDAARSKRPPDPHIVPVTPALPPSQAPKVAIVAGGEEHADGVTGLAVETNTAATTTVTDHPVPVAPVGPVRPDPGVVEATAAAISLKDTTANQYNDGIGGGAWGAGVTPDSYLAKLMDEQEQAGGNNEYDDMASTSGFAGGSFGGGDTLGQECRGAVQVGGGRGNGRGGRGRGEFSGGGHDNDDSYYHKRNKRSRDGWRN
jgi:hypothetical protein